MIVRKYKDGTTLFRSGSGPYYVEYSRDPEGDLVWVEIVTDDEALFRADGDPVEEQLWIAADMVRARNHEIKEMETRSSRVCDSATPPTHAPNKGTKHDQGKPRMDLVPVSALVGMAKAFTFGAAKYDPTTPDGAQDERCFMNNWRQGLRWGSVYAAVLRHLTAFWSGEDLDPESGLNHLDHALACIAMLREMIELHPEMNDRPTREAILSQSGDGATDNHVLTTSR